MAVYLGIDMGTTGLKALLVHPDGRICGSGYREYPISIPAPGHAEQEPEHWWKALKETLAEALFRAGISADEIAGIGLSGQMHGTVMLGEDDRPLAPAIVWCDQRSTAEVAEIHEKADLKTLGSWTQNPVSVGFQVSSLMWVRKHRPEIYSRICHVLLPKDYIRFRLTGMHGSEPTDACSTLLFNCAKRDWSTQMLEAVGIDRGILPDCAPSPCAIQGGLCASAARELNLRPGIPVVFGGGDQPMQAIGNGILSPGDTSITLGTGGQIFVPIATPAYDPQLRLHTFCHAPENTWYIMGATLNCCLAQNWFCSNVLDTHDFEHVHRMASEVPPGSLGLYFLPYLTGERTPHFDAQARGMFFGLTLRHNRASISRSVIEGISYALLDAMTCIQELNPEIRRLVVSGGGAHSILWKQIIADMFDRPIYTTSMSEEAGVGAAICAMVGTGAYSNLHEACASIVRYDDSCIMPIPDHTAYYREHFKVFQKLYQTNKALFSQC